MLCVPSLVCDVVVGNVPGAYPDLRELIPVDDGPPIEQSIKVTELTLELPIRESSEMIGIVENKSQTIDTAENLHYSSPSTIACAVETRAQVTGKDKGLRALAAVRVPDVNVSAKEFQTEQSKDETLKKCFAAAEEVSTEDGKRNHYLVVDDLLYRTFNSGGGEVWKQLVVPHSLREQVMCIGHDTVMSGHLGVKKSSDRSEEFLLAGHNGRCDAILPIMRYLPKDCQPW